MSLLRAVGNVAEYFKEMGCENRPVTGWYVKCFDQLNSELPGVHT